jgi:hypothetical protein
MNLRWDCRRTLDDGSPMCIVSPPCRGEDALYISLVL